MKRLIINADDFGLSCSINRGIIESFSKGALTSTSLLVNMPGFDDAVRLIRENQSLSTGIHINVLRGKPISPAKNIKSLCKEGFFRGSIANLLVLPYFYKEILSEFDLECRAQIEKAISSGVQITHLDSEKHVHMIPSYFKVILKIAREYGISRIRCVNEIPYLNHDVPLVSFLNKQVYAALYLSLCSKENRKLLDTYNLNSPEHFFGVSKTGNVTLEDYIRIISNIKEGTTEIMCHPGYIDHEWQEYPLNREKYYINASREQELGILLSPKIKELIDQENVSLMPYGAL